MLKFDARNEKHIKMKISARHQGIDGRQAWDIITEHVKSGSSIKTITGLSLNARFVGNCIFIKGGTPGTKRAEKGEYLTARDFIAAFDIIKDWEEINTGNVKPYIKRQQTPFIALLHNAGILE